MPYESRFSKALAAFLVISESPTTLFKVNARLDAGAASTTFYIHLYNATALPADGDHKALLLARPRKVVHTNGTDDEIEISFEQLGIRAEKGVVVVLSSTEFTLTKATDFLSAQATTSGA